METEFLLENEQGSRDLAQKIATDLKPGDVLAFSGELGSGKSFFCREIIKKLCGKNTNVVSPTFNLLQTYKNDNGILLYHFDLYRLSFFEEIFEIGIEEALQTHNICLIE